MKKIILIFAAAAIFCAGLPGCASAEKSGGEPSENKVLKFTVKTLDNETVDESIFAAHDVTFINYWATWCGPCVRELPELEELYQKYKGKIGFIGICDDAADSAGASRAKGILEKSGATYTNLMVFDEAFSIFGAINAVPCSVIVDKDGKPLCENIVGAVGNDMYSRYIDAAVEAAKR
jgi:thiol-disulfide isomerase/thioredoxin